MEISLLSKMLDDEFKVALNDEDLVQWAVTDRNRQHVEQDFLAHRTGLMINGSETVGKVLTAVFVTERVVKSASKEKNPLIFTHHNFDYYEDERGLQPIAPNALETLLGSNCSIYVAHAPLDTHRKYGTSLSLARLVGIEVDEFFFDYFGAPVALIGHVPKIAPETFAEHVRRQLRRPFLTLHKHRPEVERVAVVAGGGDIPEILAYAGKAGCDTLLTGTVEHRWAIPSVQEGNRKFHEMNEALKLNLVGGTHYATERPAMLEVVDLFRSHGIPCDYCEDEELLQAT